MSKPLLDSRRITIKRLREFLQESVNLEPELEQFVKILIFSLEYAELNNTTIYSSSSERPSKVQH